MQYLVVVLRGDWNESAWTGALGELRNTKGSSLAVETYSLYCQLLLGPPSDFKRLIDLGASLFDRRANDAYFRGGDQTDGGGPGNAFTVDYRLAAIIKKIGGSHETRHQWG